MVVQELIDRSNEFTDQEVGVSNWVEVTQEMTNEFGRSTDDIDPAHMDPDWANEHSPFGRPVAFGFWTLSMLTTMTYDVGFHKKIMSEFGEYYPINYGLEKVRFISFVPIGSFIRCRVVYRGIEYRRKGRYLFTTDNIVEIKGEEKPALTARWLGMMVLKND